SAIESNEGCRHASCAAYQPICWLRRPETVRTHVDTDALKRSRPIADVVASYGIDLRRVGRTLVGRCPFHTDSGRPNLYVYPATDSFYCFRCGIGGDAITFVEQSDGVTFLEAVERLGGGEARFSDRPPI